MTHPLTPSVTVLLIIMAACLPLGAVLLVKQAPEWLIALSLLAGVAGVSVTAAVFWFVACIRDVAAMDEAR